MGGGRDATETGTPVDMQYGGADSEEAGRQQQQRKRSAMSAASWTTWTTFDSSSYH